MGGFEVPVAALGAAGSAGGAVADGVRGVDLAGPADLLAAAVPGGRAQQAAGEAARRWTGVVASLADGMARHAGALGDSAQAYAEVDGLVAGSLLGGG